MENFEYIGNDRMMASEFAVVGYGYRTPVLDFDGSICDWEAEVELDIKVDDVVYQEMIEMVHYKTQCNACNTHIRYIVVAQHENGSIHVLGSECGNDLANFSSEKVDRMKEVSMAKRKKLAKELAMKKFYADNAGIEEALNCDHKISKDLKSKLKQYGSLSEKQVALAIKLDVQAKEWAEKRKAENQDAKPVVEGRLKKVEMTLISAKPKVTEWGEYTALLLKHVDGWKCWGKVGVNTELEALEEETTLIFSGTISKGGKDEFFGFFKRGLIHEIQS